MFRFRDSREGGVRVDVAFTDSTIDVRASRPGLPGEIARVEQACGVRFARLHQVHGNDVLLADPAAPDDEPDGDGLVTTQRGVGLMVRAADCVPVVLADADAGVAGAVHAGRNGVATDVVPHAVERMREQGATAITAWVGPHVCARCYEVPDAMRAEVSAVVPATYAVSRTGTPALDIGAGVLSQLGAAGVEVVEVGGCTREDAGLHSYRRDGDRAGRLAGLVWMT